MFMYENNMELRGSWAKAIVKWNKDKDGKKISFYPQTIEQ